MAQGTIAHNKRIKKAMNEMVRDMDADYFVTLNFNRDTKHEAARKALRAWHARVDKALLGGSWSPKPVCPLPALGGAERWGGPRATGRSPRALSRGFELCGTGSCSRGHLWRAVARACSVHHR